MRRSKVLLAAVTCGLAVASFVLVVGSSADASTRSVASTADAYVRADRPTANFGTLDRLYVDGRPGVARSALLRFPVQVPPGERITSLTPRAYNVQRPTA